MAWGFLIALWGTAAFGSSPDGNSCAAYLALLEIQSRTHAAEIRSKQAGISPEAKAYWEEEFRELALQFKAQKKALFEEKATRLLSQQSSGGILPLDAASTESLEAYHATQPAGNSGPAKIVRLSDQGERMLVVPQESFEMHLWDVKRNKFWILKMDARIVDAAFDWNGNVLVLDRAGAFALFAADGRPLGTRLPHSRTKHIAFSSKQLLRLADDLRLANEGGYSAERTFDLPPLPGVQFLRITSDSRLAAIAVGRTVHLIDLENGARLKTFPEFNPTELVALEFALDTHRLVGLGEDGALSVWSQDAMSEVYQLQLEQMDATCLALDAEGNAFVGGSQNGGLTGAVVVVDLETGEETRRFNPEHPGGVGAIALSDNGSTLVTTSAKTKEIRFHRNPLK